MDGRFADAISILEELRTKLKENPDAFGLIYFSPGEVFELNLESRYQLEIDLARAYEMNGDIDKAIGVLEERTRFDASKNDFRLVPPKVYYDLGRLYEKKELNEKVRENYTKFLDLWKDADLGISEVEDAKRKVQELRGR